MTTPVDLGNVYAETILADAAAAIAAANLAAPGQTIFITGAGVNIFDCCDGQLWTRLAAFYPTTGNGDPFNQARIDFDIPAWAYVIELGILWCHQNLNEDGSMIDPALERAFAERDGEYRLALYTALTQTVPPHLEANCGRGYRLSPWTPVGPEGGCSGGVIAVTIIATAIAG